MEYTRLGSSGLQVSRISLGCMSYGEPGRGDQSWSLDEEASRPFFKQALDAGVTFFDTANVYSAGSSEGITGRMLLSLTRRDEVVIATKVQQRMGPGPNGHRLSRGAIMTKSTPACDGWGRTTSISTWFTAPTRRLRGRRRSRPCTTWFARERCATSARRSYTPGSSQRPSTSPTSTAGHGSSAYNTTTTSPMA